VGKGVNYCRIKVTYS